MTDSILIVGGGVAGLQAAIDCANAGARAVVVENDVVVGGKMAAPMTGSAPGDGRIDGVVYPRLQDIADNPSIEVFTMTDLVSVSGRPGNFTVELRERARFVTDTCTRCNHCRAVCPVVVPNEYDAGLTYRKAVYTPLDETYPGEYVINIDNCLNTPPNYLPCQRCVEVCDDDSIHFDLPLEQTHERQVGAVILTPGFDAGSTDALRDLGYGVHPDVVTSAELQRLLESPGPTGGFVSKPSNEEYPDSVLLILSDLSPFAAYVAMSQAHRLVEQNCEGLTLLVLAQQGSDTNTAEIQRLSKAAGITVYWGSLNKIESAPDNRLQVSFVDFTSNRIPTHEYDLVVLCAKPDPSAGLEELAAVCEVTLDEHGFIAAAAADDVHVATSRPGFYAAGCGTGLKSVADSVAEAHAAAGHALDNLDPRLLRPGYSPHRVEKPATEKPERPDTDMRNDIENMLYALLKLGDK